MSGTGLLFHADLPWLRPLSSSCSPVALDHFPDVYPSASVCTGTVTEPERLLGPTVRAGRTGAHRRPAPSLDRASPLLRGNVPVGTEEHTQTHVLAGPHHPPLSGARLILSYHQHT